jgi:hypothetical protein
VLPASCRQKLRVDLPARCRQHSGALLAVFLLAFTTHARINVTSLPGRDSVQLTIYNSVDLTLVKETRTLTFKKGSNRLEFSWANTLIDPTSVEFRPLQKADQIEVLDVRFPPRVTNTLEWNIHSEVAGEVKVEIRYFTSGIAWAADYVCEANATENQMTFAGNVRVTNRSGEDYPDAQIRLMVGVVRLVERIVDLSRPSSGKLNLGIPADKPVEERDRLSRQKIFKEMDGKASQKAKAVVKEAIGEYFLYTVEGRDTIANGWSKRLPSFKAAEVPITSYYKYEKERYGAAVIRFYKFKNDKDSKLGTEPLPDGSVMAFRSVTKDNLYNFVGRTAVKYIPIDEEVEMQLGNDAEVRIEPKMMDWKKEDIQFDKNGNVTGWTTKATWEIELQNSKSIPVTVDIRRNFAGDWELATDDKFEKVDAKKIKFVLALKPNERRTVQYELTTRHGTSVRK